MLLNDKNGSIAPLHLDSITFAEGVHRAINTPKVYENITAKFYTDILGAKIKGKVNSVDALYMPWIVGKTSGFHNLSPDKETIEGPQLLLVNFHGFQFVYSLAEDNFSMQKQLEEKSHYGFIFEKIEDLKKLQADLKNKIKQFNKSIQQDIIASKGLLNEAQITDVSLKSNSHVIYQQHSFYVEDMYANKIEYKCMMPLYDRLKHTETTSDIIQYNITIRTPKQNLHKTKEFYAHVLGAEVKEILSNKLVMDFHGLQFECEGEDNFIYPIHDTIEPAHFGFNIKNVNLLNSIYTDLKNKIDEFNKSIPENQDIQKAKVYPMSRRKINGFNHDAFFVEDMYHNFIELKCFYK